MEMSPQELNAITGQYARTILDLSVRLSNAAWNVLQLSETNASLTKRVAELEKQLAAQPQADTT